MIEVLTNPPKTLNQLTKRTVWQLYQDFTGGAIYSYALADLP
jgi:hypothetical protein